MTQVDTDLALLRRFSEQGDQAAFSEIVRRYAGMVFAVGRRIIGDRARAEDVSQETFYRLMSRPESVSHSLGGWLHRAATRLAVDECRGEGARRRREALAATERAESVSESSDESGPRWAEVSPYIDEALAALPEDSRDLLVRHFLGGVAQQDLAIEFKTSAATLSRRMKMAIDLLRREMRRRGVDIAPSALAVLFARHGIEAASASLLHELGKMSMLSGMRVLARAAARHWTSRAAGLLRPVVEAGWPLGAAALSAALVTLMVLLMRPGAIHGGRNLSPSSATHATTVASAANHVDD